jgi:hypothetical protein
MARSYRTGTRERARRAKEIRTDPFWFLFSLNAEFVIGFLDNRKEAGHV